MSEIEQFDGNWDLAAAVTQDVHEPYTHESLIPVTNFIFHAADTCPILIHNLFYVLISVLDTLLYKWHAVVRSEAADRGAFT